MSTPAEINTILNQSQPLLNNAWLSAVISNLPQAVIIEDEHHIIQIANQQLCSLFHIKTAPGALAGKRSGELFNEVSTQFDHPQAYGERIRFLVTQKQAVQKEIVHLADGRLLLRDYIPLWQNEKLTGHMWLYSEETSRLKADALLAEQQKFYENILNSIPSDIAVFSPDQRYLYINPVGVKDPTTRKWLIGKDDFDYCQMRGKDRLFAQQRRDMFNEIAASGKEKEWEERIVNKDGEVEYHLRKMSPLYDDNNQLVWMIGYSVNITERKKFEEKLKLSERRYRDLFNYSQAIICTHDLTGNFLTINPSFTEILGYEEQEVIGKNISVFLLPEDQSGFEDLYLSSINNHNKVQGLFRFIHKSGRKVYLLYQNYKLAESSDSDAYIICFAQDVSDRIKAEKELKEAKKITEETARNKERFLANMSHEIRTPMNGIIGITSFLQRTSLNDQQKNYLNIIQESAHDLLNIINDILDLEKVGTGKIQLEKIPFDIVSKTNTVIKLFELPASNKGVEIKFVNGIGNNLCVAGDPTRYSQVMNNLISNAVKFTHNGTIQVKTLVETETETHIRIRVVVEDSGIGIDPNNIDRIFQPFTQAYANTTRKYGGTGLGLAITKNLIELQGGKIQVESQPGKGSSFSFSIGYDKCRESQRKLIEPKSAIKNELGQLNILLAEDNDINILLTKGMLAVPGFTTTIATTGNQVIEQVLAADFDVILMDIQMPEKNGFQATIEIRNLADERKRNIPIIALTANALAGEDKKYIAAGMNDYLTKPFTQQSLYNKIADVIQHTSANTEPHQKNSMSPTEPPQKLYDLTVINELARGNQEFIINLARIFIETVPPTSKEMVDACEQKKWEQVGKLAHKLKSTIDTMCISSLKDDIRIIEKNGKDQKNLDTIAAMVTHTDAIIQQVSLQLTAEFNL